MAVAGATGHQDVSAGPGGGLSSDNYWSSSENNANNAWNQNFANGNQNNNNKNNNNRVRAVRGFVRAGASPRAAAFEMDYEARLVRLQEEINSGAYSPQPCVAFVVDRPVKREVFAADFRDRVVHHLLINKINHLFEREFIHDSYACRVGRGTHFGIKRVARFMKQASANYTRPAYVLKLDIRGFFMSIDREFLVGRLERFLHARYHAYDRELILDLCRKTIRSDPARDCLLVCSPLKWRGLPRDKSLFRAPNGRGLPIGNLTSQVFANFYLNPLDHFIKHSLGVRYYGRYVGDLVIVGRDRSWLTALVPQIETFLSRELHLTLNPNKRYLQDVRHGVGFLGAVIKPGRTYPARRTKSNFGAAVARHNRIADDNKPTRSEQEAFRQSVNSYLGMLRHYSSYRLRVATLRLICPYWWRYFVVSRTAEKVTVGKPGAHAAA